MTVPRQNPWGAIAQAVETVMQGDDARDIAALLAANMMADCIREGRRIPTPTPELCAQLAHAEVLAQRA